MKLEGKVVLVTGGGSGFGEAMCGRFAGEGARVAVLDRSVPNGTRVAEALARAGAEVVFAQADVSDASEVERAFGEVEARFGPIDVLVNNAGIASPIVPIEEMEETLFDDLFTVNVKSVFLCTRRVVPGMKAHGGGVILNTASTSALRPRPRNAGYAASKAAVLTLTKALSQELAPANIRVNALTPVAADTPLFREFVGDDEAYVERIASMIPLGRLCGTEDLAAAAVFLASDDARYLTGVSLPIDGGWTAG